MTKKEAISIISKCVMLYAANLCDRQLAFVYRNALDKRLKESDIQFKNNHTTELKLQILQSIMKIPFSARMIGDYTGAHLDLYTEKVAGTTTACLGLILRGNEYIPNTILKEDIRNIIPKPP